MDKFQKKTSRRIFLKDITSSIAALTIVNTRGSNISDLREDPGNDLKVFSKGQIGSLSIKNRLVRAATLERAGKDGYPTESYLKMYESQAKGGAGLILTGAMAVAVPVVYESQIFIYHDRYNPGLEKIVKAVHNSDNSCKIMAQLIHFDDKYSPSGISWTDKDPRGIMSVEQIKSIINSFSEAIRRAENTGFDGVELNAHFVYLLSSFLSPHTNKREDEYGGSVENRVRLVREIVEQSRVLIGNDFPIMIKFNCDDSFSPDTTVEDGINIDNFHLLASEIQKAGFDAIEISGNSWFREDINSPDKESYFSKYTETLDLSIPVILTGGNRSLDNIEAIIKRGKIDFFGFARPFIREQDLAKRWYYEGSTVKSKCIRCNSCLSDKDPLHCLQEG